VNEVVFDASALLALINAEPGHEKVSPYIPGAFISSINLAEVVTKLSEAGLSQDVIRSVLEPLKLSVVSFEKEDAYATGLLRSTTKSLGLSLGDRACLVVSKRLNLPVLTTDKLWASLSDFDVQMIR
jgi:PIN domain nuclease of toxin-antitoxin system